MTTMVFVNFPVTDIQASTTFYEKTQIASPS